MDEIKALRPLFLVAFFLAKASVSPEKTMNSSKSRSESTTGCGCPFHLGEV